MIPSVVTVDELLAKHDALLLDAYGVLVDGSGVLAGAASFMSELNRRGVPYAIVTNDASRSPSTYAQRFASVGLFVDVARIVTSGSLIPSYFRERGLVGARTLVLGTDDSYQHVVDAGGVPVALGKGMEVDAVVVCDDAGTPYLEGIELALSAIVRAIDAGRSPSLVLANPDLVYPKGQDELGFTAGSMALLIETALARRFHNTTIKFDLLGKPSPRLFLQGKSLLSAANPVMIGDQLETDIVGALAAGIPAALLRGVSRWQERATITPTYLLEALSLVSR